MTISAPMEGPRRLSIPKIQSTRTESPYVNQEVETSGVITAVKPFTDSRGRDRIDVWVQDPAGDNNPRTSDAIRATVDAIEGVELLPGMTVKVLGKVAEVKGMTSIFAKPFEIISKGDPTALPKAISLKPPSAASDAERYFEHHEGMLVSIDTGRVTSPTTGYELFTIVDPKHKLARQYDMDDTPQHIRVSGDIVKSPRLRIGDRVKGVQGPLDYSFNEFRVLPTSDMKVEAKNLKPGYWGDVDGSGAITGRDLKMIADRAGKPIKHPYDLADLDANGKITPDDIRIAEKRMLMKTGAPSYSVATLNVENLFDTEDNPEKNDTVASEMAYRAKLGKIAGVINNGLGAPDIIGLQEVENEKVLKDLAEHPEIRKLGYQYSIMQGPDKRGINVALFYRPDRGVALEGVTQLQGTTKLRDKYGEPGDKKSGQLFTRPPLTADLSVTDAKTGVKQLLTVVVNHFTSKFSPDGTPTDPWRVEQSTFLRDWANEAVEKNPERAIIALGDFNDYDTSTAMKLLDDRSQSSLFDTAKIATPKGERYTYQYRGSSQAIDHIFATKSLVDQIEEVRIAHLHADTPEPDKKSPLEQHKATDHDPVVASFRFPEPPKDSKSS